MRRAIPALSILTLVLVALWMVSGCEDSEGPCGPVVPAGRVQGRVSVGGGVPSEGLIDAVPLPGSRLEGSIFQTQVDFYGDYSLDLPAGQYTIQLTVNRTQFRYEYCGAEIGYGNIPPETVTIGNGSIVTGIDFPLASLHVQVDLSHGLNGERGRVVLHRRDAQDTGVWYTFVDRGEEEIENGNLDFYVKGILPGEYRVEVLLGARQYLCDCPYDGEHVWPPGVRDPEDSPWQIFAPDSLVTVAMSLAENPARIEGRVSGAWLEMGLEAPELSILTEDRITVMGRRQILDSEGNFGIDLHLPGTVKLLLTQNGLETWVGGEDFESATVFDLALGEVIGGVDVVQSGLLIDVQPAGWSLASADLEFRDPADLSLITTASLTSMLSGGVVGVPNIPPGEYLLYLVPNARERGDLPWRPQWYDRVVSAEQATPIVIPSAGDVVPLTVTLEPGGSVSGTVAPHAETGAIFYIIATAVDDVTANWQSLFLPQYQETYQVVGLPDGTYKVGVVSPVDGWNYGDPAPSATVWYPGTTWDEAEAVTIIDAGEVTGLTITLPQ